MSKRFNIMTPEIEAIDREIARLRGERHRIVEREVKKRVRALCAEAASEKQGK